MKKISFEKLTLLPLASSVFALILHVFIPSHKSIMTKDFNHFKWFLIALSVIFLVLAIISIFNEKLRKKYAYKSWFIAGMILLLSIYNLVTLKFLLLPAIYFPYPDKIIDVFHSQWAFLLKCVAYSLRLLLTGVICGGVIGVLTGVAIGCNKKASYWINPLVKIIGPIPPTVWIPIALVTFSTSFNASVFIIGISVWFPTTVLTSSGILNLENSYFEVANTLGASSFYKIRKIAIPGALPSVFIGFFNGITAAFITLMTAEMIGVKFGIGWYIDWQRGTMSYANVFAGLIVIGITCSLIVTIIFRVRDRLLKWQKGVIKW